MKFITNTNRKKRISIVVLFIALFFLGYDYYQTSQPNIWGDEPDESYITITGKKPTDTHIVAWAAFWVMGDECKTYSYDMFGRKAHQGGKIDKKYTYNFSDDPNRYELRLPFKSVVDNNDCNIELRDFQVNVLNNFDGIAGFRAYPQGELPYEKAISTSMIIEARDCNAEFHQGKNDMWDGWFNCEYFVGNKSRLKDVRPYEFYYDFSQFSDDTIIKFNVLAGENYRSEPLDKEKGPQ
ncbi:hypothetical protein [Vibrio anguillarum]|uniref:hypothetical protein n=1 Tax=Vibrio anguillarum TaxID=55601 RepID=UPI00188A6A44|nr:hypothetical protein [Vibrio anguillarum]MBF4335649.1 hypothetical protein [Vibrio anguillarum]